MNKSTVLLIDDAPAMGQFLALFLGKKFDVTVCSTQEEASNLLRQGFNPDIIVSDFEMPGLAGGNWIAKLKKLCPATPIMVISGHKGSRERIAALQAGACDYLPKPFHPAEIELRVSKQIRMSSKSLQIINKNNHQNSVSFAI